jgi:hypothetical protein
VLGRLFDKWAGAKQAKELKSFVDNFSAADASELGIKTLTSVRKPTYSPATRARLRGCRKGLLD